MSRACRSLGYLLALALLQAVVLYLALFSPLLPREHPLYMHSYASVPVKYKRLGRSDIQQKLVIVSDITSHFGRDTAVKLAELGFFVLGGVRVESERKAFTGYNAVKGLETFVLNIADPMDMVQMSYRVSQIERKYSRSLYGIVIVDTYQTGDVSVSSSQWTKQKKLQKKLQLSNSGNESSVITPQEKEQLFHMNTRDYFDLHEMHTKYQNVFQGPYRLLQVCHDLASNHPQGVDFRVTYLRPAIVSSNLDRGSLFSDDLISHSEAFLESKEIDETAVSNMTSSLAVVEYAATPPKTFFAPKPSKNKRGTKSSKKRVQRVSSQDQEVSTTSTPSPVTTDDVSLAIIHSFAAEHPLNRYLLGSIKLNFTLSPMVCPGWSELPGTCANSADETCENIALSQLILDTVKYIMNVMLYYIRMFLGNLLEWSDVQVVMVPLASVDLLVYVLPPFVSDYLWQLVGPCITGVA